MAENGEIKQSVLEWFKSKSHGEKKKWYLMDVVKGLADQYPKKDVRNAVNDCIYEGTLNWFSTGSTNMLVLPEYFKG